MPWREVAGVRRKQPRNSLHLHRTNPGVGWAGKGPGVYGEPKKGEKINIKTKYVMNIQTQERDVLKKKIFLLLLGRATF